MTKSVVDGLEAIDVDIDEGSRPRRAAGKLEILLAEIVEPPSVVQFGEAVDQRQTPESSE